MSRRKPYQIHESAKAPRAWRSFEEKDADPQVLREAAESERPGGFIDSKSLTSRRSFMKVSAMTAAAVGVEGCVRRPVENIVPYTQGPEYLQPGVPLNYATVTSRGADAIGLVVTTHEGRPTKVNGNLAHPSSNGASDISAQVSVLDLYDSERLRTPSMKHGNDRADHTIEQFDEAFGALVAANAGNGGAGLRFLTQGTNSPTFIRLREQVLARLPRAKFHTYSSVNDSNVAEGARLAFGRPLRAVHQLETAKVIVSIDSDFLGEETGAIRNGRAFGASRRIETPSSEMSRLYVVEAGHSVTGSAADHRLRLPSSRIENYLKALARKLGSSGVDLSSLTAGLAAPVPEGVSAQWVDAVAADLVANRGTSVVLVGRRQPARVHALAHAINAALGNLGRTVVLVPNVDAEAALDEVASLKALVDDAANVTTLVLFGGNPVYDAPSDIDVAGLLRRDGVTSVHLASHLNETAALCTWAVPETHELEAWGDARAIDGTMSIQQPMMESLWFTRSAIELLARVANVRNWRGAYLVRETQRALTSTPALFERDFRRILHVGVVGGSTYAPLTDVVPDAAAIAAALTAQTLPAIGPNAMELQFVPCPKLHDGRHANNLWALELPDPMTKLVWDNAALVSKATRNALGARDGDMIKITANGKSVELPVYALAGTAENCITLLLGWGRTAAGRHGNGKGFDVQPLRTSGAFNFVSGARVEKLASHYDLVITQEHDRMEGRPIAIDATLDEYREEPDFASYRTVDFNNGPLWTEQNYEGEKKHKWGMVIDLSGCFGCNACVVACQAENNIPTVGKREVARGREMFWLRIDRYFLGDSDAEPQVALQPVGCQHCEEAPCENVCPVNATAHSPEGLNDMAYNRCIGTRYCANNCPYKVRRFNYLDWHTQEDEFEQATNDVNLLFAPAHSVRTAGNFDRIKQMQFNPNVTVRMRGVIEKCSYCVQSIQEAKIAARREQREIGANEITTACQAACASGCITFGDYNNPESRAAQLAQRDRRYSLLAEVGAQPRTIYLAKIRNPNPAMGGADHAGAEGAH